MYIVFIFCTIFIEEEPLYCRFGRGAPLYCRFGRGAPLYWQFWRGGLTLMAI